MTFSQMHFPCATSLLCEPSSLRGSSLPTEILYRELQAGDNLSLLHFVNFPRGAIHLSHFSTSRFYLFLFFPLILALSLILPIVPISLFLSLPLSIRLSCGACTISISCGYPVADSRHESRHHPAGVCRGNAKRQTGSLSPFSPSSTSAYPTSLSLSSFSSTSICISFSLLAYPLSLFLSSSSCLSRSLPIHRKVVVPGMRLIPREYQELSKRTEVG